MPKSLCRHLRLYTCYRIQGKLSKPLFSNQISIILALSIFFLNFPNDLLYQKTISLKSRISDWLHSTSCLVWFAICTWTTTPLTTGRKKTLLVLTKIAQKNTVFTFCFLSSQSTRTSQVQLGNRQGFRGHGVVGEQGEHASPNRKGHGALTQLQQSVFKTRTNTQTMACNQQVRVSKNA